jgi:hypothetical protein
MHECAKGETDNSSANGDLFVRPFIQSLNDCLTTLIELNYLVYLTK